SSISSYMAGQISNQYLHIGALSSSSSINTTFSAMLKSFIAAYYPFYTISNGSLNYGETISENICLSCA
ncbi:MAG: hypothetical protein OH316_00630, partial [Candidatus Parvarchaeota archaeon]|nr:hypothetical protein [Candidatus Parvarchaeota archaeon]